MRFEDVVISALFASAATLVILTAWAYRTPLARAFRRLGEVLRDGLVEILRRFRPWQAFAAAFAAVLLYTLLDQHAYRDGYFFLAIAAAVAIGFTVLWCREFLFLMGLRDDDLPGRFDKPIWAALLIALPPLGLLLFRSHRLAHWPEPEPKPRVAPVARELA
jgi:hypothetical protein